MATTKVQTELIAADAITGAHIADDAIDSEHYTNASIDNAHLADDAVDSAELAAGSVDLAHMSVNSIDSDQYIDGSIDLAHMSVNSIDSNQYVDGSIDTAHLAADVVTGAKIADDAIDSEHYTDGSIDNAHIADDAIDSEHYVDGSIDTAHLADDAVTSAKLDTNIAVSGTLGVTGETTLATHLNMGDSDIIKLGTGSDFQLYHDGSESFIKSQSHDIRMWTGTLKIKSADGSETMLEANENAEVQLRYNGNKKIETTNVGIDITGIMEADNVTIAGAQGSDGQVLTSTGSGVAWEDASGGATDLDGLTDAKSQGTNFTRSLILGHQSHGTLSSATDNTLVGIGAGGSAITSANSVTAIGAGAGGAITSGGDNTIIGKNALDACLTGTGNIAIGGNALGLYTGSDNTAVGYAVLDAATSATHQTAVGYYALSANQTGAECTAVGYNALANTTHWNNTAVGSEAATSLVAGYNCTAVGFQAMQSGTGAAANTAIGALAMKNCNSASTTQTTAIGYNACGGSLAGYGNTAVGDNTLSIATSAFDNTVMGRSAGLSITTGDYNVIIGSYAGDALSTVSNSVVIGYHALSAMSTQNNYCTIVGFEAAKVMYGSGALTAVGARAAYGMTTGIHNVAIGNAALYNCNVGGFNTALGANVATGVTNGGGCIFIGVDTQGVNCGNANTVIGNLSRTYSTAGFDQIVLSSGSLTGTANNRAHIGNNTAHLYCDFESNATWTHSSDERRKKDIVNNTLGLSFINDLTTRQFKFKAPSEYPTEWDSYSPPDYINPVTGEVDQKTEPIDTKVHHGLIAQEVKQAMDNASVTDFDGWGVHEDGQQQISREMFVIPLIKALQELSAKNDALEARIITLEG